MKAISIRQPWAWLIVDVAVEAWRKDIENRTWETKFRGDVLIHAAQGMTVAEYESAREFVRRFNPHLMIPKPEALKRGGIVGMARIIDCVQRSPSRWFMGPKGFVLDREKSYPLPFRPCRGQLGIYECGDLTAEPVEQADEV